MSGSNLNSPSLSLNVANGNKPQPSKIYSFNVALTSGVTAQIDLRSLQNLNILHQIQAMFVDNSANTQSATVTISTGMSILVPGLSQGFFPIFVPPNAPVFNVTGNGSVTITLTNFAMPAAVWGNVSLGNIFTGATLQVQDPALEATINSLTSSLNTTPKYLSNADAWAYPRLGSVAIFKSLSASVVTSFITGAPSAFVTGIYASLTPNATMATAGNLTVTLLSTTTANIATRTIFVPASASNQAVEILNLNNLNVTPGATDSISVSLSSSLTAGAVEVTLWGGTTAIT